MAAIGLILVLGGFIYAIPRGGLSGSAALRNIGLGMQGVHATPGEAPQKHVKQQWARSAMGVLAIIAGGLIVHFATL